MKLVFATNNQNKLKEVQKMLPKSINLLSLAEIGCAEDIAETGVTLQENAQIKADYIKQKYGYDCFADDTGLEVISLNNEPGVYSARYAGKNANSEDNMQKLLTKLEPKENRNAQFRTVVCFNLNNERHFFEGICKGEILKSKQGEDGFGYDPIFKPTGFTESFAQMSMEQKGKISHRGLAMKKFFEFINKLG